MPDTPIPPLAKNRPVLDFLASRRSRPAKTLRAPYPDREALAPLLEMAARTPDHGKLEPWRFVVLSGPALPRLGALARARAEASGLPPEKVEKAGNSLSNAGCVVAVIASPKTSEKIPHIEQVLSAGAVCLALVNAALAAGWGANWLSEFAAHDAEFGAQGLGLSEEEFVAGFIHLGTEGAVPPERPRPDLSGIVSWVDE